MSNLLSEVHPELIGEWSDKNLPLTPDKITFASQMPQVAAEWSEKNYPLMPNQVTVFANRRFTPIYATESTIILRMSASG